MEVKIILLFAIAFVVIEHGLAQNVDNNSDDKQELDSFALPLPAQGNPDAQGLAGKPGKPGKKPNSKPGKKPNRKPGKKPNRKPGKKPAKRPRSHRRQETRNGAQRPRPGKGGKKPNQGDHKRPGKNPAL